MNNKALKKKVAELTTENKALKESLDKLKKDVKDKKEEVMVIREQFYNKQNPNEDEKKIIEQNKQKLEEIFEKFKNMILTNKKKNIITLNFDKISESSHFQYKEFATQINQMSQECKEKDALIVKTFKEIDKYTKSNDVKFDVENYIINPAMEFTNPISELSLASQVYKKFTRLHKKNEVQNQELLDEIEEYKNELNELKKVNGLQIEEEKDNNDKPPIEFDQGTNRSADDNDNDNEDSFDNTSVVIDLSEIKVENLPELIESPRFADKVISNNKKIKPIKLDLDIEKEENPPTIIKLKHVDVKKVTVEMLVEQIEASLNTIEDLKQEINEIELKSKQMIKKKNKLTDNIKFTETKIEIVKDQMQMIQNQIEKLKQGNQGEEMLIDDSYVEEVSHVSNKSTNKKE